MVFECSLDISKGCLGMKVSFKFGKDGLLFNLIFRMYLVLGRSMLFLGKIEFFLVFNLSNVLN